MPLFAIQSKASVGHPPLQPLRPKQSTICSSARWRGKDEACLLYWIRTLDSTAARAAQIQQEPLQDNSGACAAVRKRPGMSVEQRCQLLRHARNQLTYQPPWLPTGVTLPDVRQSTALAGAAAEKTAVGKLPNTPPAFLQLDARGIARRIAKRCWCGQRCR